MIQSIDTIPVINKLKKQGFFDSEGNQIRSLRPKNSPPLNELTLSFPLFEGEVLYRQLWTSKKINKETDSKKKFVPGIILGKILAENEGSIEIGVNSSQTWKILFNDINSEELFGVFLQSNFKPLIKRVKNLIPNQLKITNKPEQVNFKISIAHSDTLNREYILTRISTQFEKAFPKTSFEDHCVILRKNNEITDIAIPFINGNFYLSFLPKALPRSFLNLNDVIKNKLPGEGNLHLKLTQDSERVLLNHLCSKFELVEPDCDFTLIDLYHLNENIYSQHLELNLLNKMKKNSTDYVCNALSAIVDLGIFEINQHSDFASYIQQEKLSLDEVTFHKCVFYLNMIIEKLKKEHTFERTSIKGDPQLIRFLMKLFQSLEQNQLLNAEVMIHLLGFLKNLGWIKNNYEDPFFDLLLCTLFDKKVPFNVLFGWLTILAAVECPETLVKNNSNFLIPEPINFPLTNFNRSFSMFHSYTKKNIQILGQLLPFIKFFQFNKKKYNNELLKIHFDQIALKDFITLLKNTQKPSLELFGFKLQSLYCDAPTVHSNKLLKQSIMTNLNNIE